MAPAACSEASEGFEASVDDLEASEETPEASEDGSEASEEAWSRRALKHLANLEASEVSSVWEGVGCASGRLGSI